MSCPYSNEELEDFDGIINPIGDACFDCDNEECEHYQGSEDFVDDVYPI